MVMGRPPSENAWSIASGTMAAISEPVNPSVLSATRSRSIVSTRPFCLRVTARISRRSRVVGRSTKKTSSKRPRRSSSGGRPRTSFAVATTNTLALVSCIQLSTTPSASEDTPPSPWSPEAPFRALSISSIQSTHGAAASATAMSLRMFCSLSPTNLLFCAPRSARKSGRPKAVAKHLAASDLPVPGGPTSTTPLGASRPYSRAFAPKASRRSCVQALSWSSPPMASRPLGSGS